MSRRKRGHRADGFHEGRADSGIRIGPKRRGHRRKGAAMVQFRKRLHSCQAHRRVGIAKPADPQIDLFIIRETAEGMRDLYRISDRFARRQGRLPDGGHLIVQGCGQRRKSAGVTQSPKGLSRRDANRRDSVTLQGADQEGNSAGISRRSKRLRGRGANGMTGALQIYESQYKLVRGRSFQKLCRGLTDLSIAITQRRDQRGNNKRIRN